MVLITVPEAARLLSVSVSQAYALASEHVLPVVYVGGRSVRINAEALDVMVRTGALDRRVRR